MSEHGARCACHLCQLNNRLGDMICDAMAAERKIGTRYERAGALVAGVVAERLSFHLASVHRLTGHDPDIGTMLTAASIDGARRGQRRQAITAAELDAVGAAKH